MKKTILLLLVTCIGLVSCKKDNYTPGNNLPPNLTLLKYINANAWKPTNSSGQTLAVTIAVPELTRATFENDEVALSISRGDNDVYTKMPFVDAAVSYTYDIQPGFITLFIQTTNDKTLIPPTPTFVSRLKIVLITSSL